MNAARITAGIAGVAITALAVLGVSGYLASGTASSDAAPSTITPDDYKYFEQYRPMRPAPSPTTPRESEAAKATITPDEYKYFEQYRPMRADLVPGYPAS